MRKNIILLVMLAFNVVTAYAYKFYGGNGIVANEFDWTFKKEEIQELKYIVEHDKNPRYAYKWIATQIATNVVYSPYVDMALKGAFSGKINDSVVNATSDPDFIEQYGIAICLGYARIMKKYCDQVGIPCRIVIAPGHAFNYVDLGDGWQYSDITWALPYLFSENKASDVMMGTNLKKYNIGTPSEIANGKMYYLCSPGKQWTDPSHQVEKILGQNDYWYSQIPTLQDKKIGIALEEKIHKLLEDPNTVFTTDDRDPWREIESSRYLINNTNGKIEVVPIDEKEQHRVRYYGSGLIGGYFFNDGFEIGYQMFIEKPSFLKVFL